MAGKKIVQLPYLGRNLLGTDILELSIDGTGSYKITGQEIIDSIPPTSVAWGDIGGILSNQTDLQTALDGKLDENLPIVAATKTKITYDVSGLVTSGADATTADIADSTNRRYVTDAQLIVLGNTSGTNTGDNATNSQYSGLATSKQDTLISGTNIKTVNSTSLLGSGNVAVQDVLVSGTNIKTLNSASLLGSGNIFVQDVLVSGTNIKTVNSASILGSGNLTVQQTLVSGTNIKTVNGGSILGSGDLSVGTVTNVLGTSPISSTGGTTPAISIATANTSTTGALTSTDWNTFNAKQDALVSGTNIKTINGSSVLGSGNLVVSGGASGFYTPIPFGSGLIYSNIPIGSSNVTLTSVSNTIYLMPFIPTQTFTTSNILLTVSSAVLSTSARFLIYSHSTANGLPDTKIYESTDLNTGTTGVKTATTSQTFTAGTTYWLGFYSNGASLFSASSTSGQIVIGSDSGNLTYTSITRSVTYGSAPTTWGTTHSKVNANFIRIGLTIA